MPGSYYNDIVFFLLKHEFADLSQLGSLSGVLLVANQFG
ncbi:hypothetical protein Hsw_4229 [Hymenobacter swuensis DY53]|uniref:Uncharacterized protein n=1 Tax=Hymenobacter swuensis DY53 TaxID=1227739 RepID=W8F339_9BACT|nr:hypothetical protein Hsw_4229 [Hymenobacter swuensis DY53]